MYGSGVYQVCVKAVLLDIEGTTSPIDFVYSVLFPYAKEHLGGYVLQHSEDGEVVRTLNSLFREYQHESVESIPDWAAPEDLEGAIAYLQWLMAQDRKSTGLKAIQGLVWQQGFESGELKGEMFPDVPAALSKWKAEGFGAYIFSSGSVLAQKLVFGHSSYGDLTPLLSGFFDTETGPKREAASYQAIAEAISFQPAQIVFVSDVPEELEAASMAGMQAKLAVRPGNKEVATSKFERISDLRMIGQP